MDDVSTMRPAALCFKWGSAALMLNIIPLRLVANMLSQALSLISSNVTGGKMPAFAQRMSTPPNSAATVAMTSSISPCSLTSPRQNITVLPRLRRASAVAAPSGSFRPSKQTRAPSWAKTPVMPLPMPLVPPVTMTDLFLIDVSTESSLFIRSASVSEGLFLGSQLTCMFHFCIFNHNQGSIERDRSQLTWSQRPFNSRGRPVLPLQELEQLPGFCKPASYARPSH